MSARKKHIREAGESFGLKLSVKKHPIKGIISTILALISMIFFLMACIISSQSKGNAGLYIGIIGIGCLILSITGAVFAWLSLNEDDIKPIFPTIGALLNFLLTLFYIVLYILGASI